MGDDYAFPQHLVRGLGAVPEGLGQPRAVQGLRAQYDPPAALAVQETGMSVPIVAQQFSWDAQRGLFATPPRSSKPMIDPVKAAGEWRDISSLYKPAHIPGEWVWYPLPEGEWQAMNGITVVYSKSTPKVETRSSEPPKQTAPGYWIWPST
jgi:hypothetical protein